MFCLIVTLLSPSFAAEKLPTSRPMTMALPGTQSSEKLAAMLADAWAAGDDRTILRCYLRSTKEQGLGADVCAMLVRYAGAQKRLVAALSERFGAGELGPVAASTLRLRVDADPLQKLAQLIRAAEIQTEGTRAIARSADGTVLLEFRAVDGRWMADGTRSFRAMGGTEDDVRGVIDANNAQIKALEVSLTLVSKCNTIQEFVTKAEKSLDEAMEPVRKNLK